MNLQRRRESNIGRGRGTMRMHLPVAIILIAYAPVASAQDAFVLPDYISHLARQASCGNSPAATYGCEPQYGPKPSCLDPFLCRSNLALPFLRKEAEARGFELPLPLGVSLVSTELDRTVAVSDLRVGIGDSPSESLDRFTVGNLDAHASSQLARVDLWLLPFLNVYGMGGRSYVISGLTVRF